MLRSVCRSLTSQRALSGLFGGAVLAALAAGPVAAEDVFLGYTDVRLTGSTMPTDGWESPNSGAATTRGNYDSAFRISLMAIGPVCSILPINCYTPARLGATSSEEAVDTYGSYDDLVVERDYAFSDNRSYSFDWLLGFELSGNSFSSSETGEPDITVDAAALTVHFGWGFEIATRTSGRWHWELTPFLGAGMAQVGVEVGAVSRDEQGVYYELGGRLGSYYTFAGGFQLGGEVRYAYAGADVEPFAGDSFSASGVTFGVNVGYRF